MAIRYTTEYSIGRRGRVCRTYGGTQAVIAIAFDLALGFAFGLIGLGVGLLRCGLVAAYRVAVAVLGLPLRAVQAVALTRPVRAAAKPAWASFDEL
jgi:hypothetical protein